MNIKVGDKVTAKVGKNKGLRATVTQVGRIDLYLDFTKDVLFNESFSKVTNYLEGYWVKKEFV